MDVTRLNDLLFLFSVSIVAGACSDDGAAAASEQGSTGNGDAGTTDVDSVATAASTTATTSPTSTVGTTSGENETTTGVETTSDSTPGSTSDATTGGGTTEEASTGRTTEASTGSNTTEGSTTDVDQTTCEQFGTFYMNCFAPGYDEVEAAATALCEEELAAYYAFSDECGLLQDELVLCIITLACNQIGSVGSGTVCDETWEAALAACM